MRTVMDSNTNCTCPCGATKFLAREAPLFRCLCHCTICQRFNAAPYGDVTCFRWRGVDMPSEGQVRFTSYKSPPLLQRGRCVQCEQPAFEYIRVLPRVVLVPTQNIQDPSLVPDLSLHIFYDTRVADADDDLPKYSGYLRSQAAFSAAMYRGLLAR